MNLSLSRVSGRSDVEVVPPPNLHQQARFSLMTDLGPRPPFHWTKSFDKNFSKFPSQFDVQLRASISHRPKIESSIPLLRLRPFSHSSALPPSNPNARLTAVVDWSSRGPGGKSLFPPHSRVFFGPLEILPSLFPLPRCYQSFFFFTALPRSIPAHVFSFIFQLVNLLSRFLSNSRRGLYLIPSAFFPPNDFFSACSTFSFPVPTILVHSAHLRSSSSHLISWMQIVASSSSLLFSCFFR